MMMMLLSEALELYRNDLACELGIAVGVLIFVIICVVCFVRNLKNEEMKNVVFCFGCLMIILLVVTALTKLILLGQVERTLEESGSAATAVIKNASELLLQNRF